MRFEVGQKRTAVAAKSLSLVLVAITVGLGAMAAVYFSQGSSAATLNAQSSSSSLGSSSSVLPSSSSAVQPAAQASSSQYPLVWAPNSPKTCELGEFSFCIEATLGFSGQTATSSTSFTTMTIIQGNTTTIVGSTETTIIHGVTTNFVYPPENGSYGIVATALVQDAATGQNITTSSGQPFISNDCSVPPTGFAPCYIGGSVPLGHTYRITVYLTKDYLPCSLRPANAQVPCESQLLAPSQTITITE